MKNSIRIAKTSGDKFLENPQEYLDLIAGDDRIGRLTISAFEGIFYLLTEDKFQFFIDYELQKQENQILNRIGLKPEKAIEEPKKSLQENQKPKNYKLMLDLKRQLRLFPNFSDQEFLSIFRDVVVSKYKKGDNIFYKDEPSFELFYVFRGEVTISHSGKSILVLKNGDFFGELAFMGSGEKSTNAQVLSSMTVVISFLTKKSFNSKEELDILLKLHTQLAKSVDDKLKKILKLNQ
ncbi:cyclic nucleotide-binding protein [Thiovulum sp. ES]|nr:cyclic nucleotide-binding protein [Thiovulum sp. ES]